MKYVGKPLNLEKYVKVDDYSREKGIYKFEAKRPENELSRKNHNSFFLKLSKWDAEQHLAEMLGFLIAKKVGFKVCEAEMLKSQRVGTPYFDTGVLSYVEKSKNDVVMLPTEMINEYRKSIDSMPEADWIYNIDEVINAVFKRVTDRHRPYEEFLNFKQDFINMVVYDIKFVNADRVADNWMIREDKENGEFDMYPMFDNASVLGFASRGIPSMKDEAKYREEVKAMEQNRQCAIITPESQMTSEIEEDYHSMLKHMLRTYPEQTKKAINAVNIFTRSDLENILDEMEDITPERKKFTLDIFDERDKGFREFCKEYMSKDKVIE